MYDIYEIIWMAILFGVPVLSLIFFIVSLVIFIRTPKENVGKKKLWKGMLIISSVILGLVAIVIIAFLLLMMAAMMYM